MSPAFERLGELPPWEGAAVGPRGRGLVELAFNENPWGPAEGVKLRLAEALSAEGLRAFPPEDGAPLHHALAERLALAQDQVVLGQGSTELLELALRGALGEGGSVVLPRYAFPMAAALAERAGGQVIEAMATPEEMDVDALLRAVRPDTRLAYLANVNNPTGARVDREAIARLVRHLREDVLLVVDQAYAEYEDPEAFPDAALHLLDRERLLVLRTFSKLHALAGLRIGYGLGSPWLASRLERLRRPHNTSRLGRLAAEQALREDAFVARCRTLNQAAREAFLREAEEHRCHVSGEGGNFLVMETIFPAEELYKDLRARGILVRPLHGCGLANHVRVTLGRPEEMAAFWEAAAPMLDGAGCARGFR